MKPKHAALLVIFLTLAAPGFSRPQGTHDQQKPQQVAYLRLVEGEVGYQRGDDSKAQWSVATINTPMMPGDSLYANDRGRAEVQLGEGNFLRLGQEGYLGFLQNSEQMFQFKVASGTATLRLQRLDRAYEIDAPNLAFSVQQPGEYRVDVNPNGDTRVTLHKGGGVASLGEHGEKYLLSPARLNVASGSAEFIVSKKFKRDDWDRWSKRRDSLDYARPHYMPPGVYGYESMSGNGTWVDTQAYGPVWIPAVAVGWQPYRLGRWVWVDPFGWTWVSYEAWGWAPYHYGRWASIEGRWAWVPGPPTVPQRFAAALVGFLTGNEGGAWLGWFPLGPGEAYHPYASGEVYVEKPVRQYVNYNYVTIVNRTEIYNSTTTVYNTRIVDRRVIEHTQVVTDCNVAPSHETLYAPAARVTENNQVVTISNIAQPAPRPADQIIQRNVHVRTTDIPTVRNFDDKLAEMQRAGVVRPVHPYQPVQPIATVNREPANSAKGAKIVVGTPNPPEHNEPHGRPAGMPPGLLKKGVAATNPAATGPASADSRGDSESHDRPAGMPPGLLKKDLPAVNSSATGPVPAPAATPNTSRAPAAPEDERRPRYAPPAALEGRIGRPASTAPVPEQARPKYEPPQEVEHRIGQPGAPRLGGEQPRPSYASGQGNERRADQPRPVAAPHDQARPAYQPPQESDRRVSQPPAPVIPRREPKPAPPPSPPVEAHANPPRPVPAEAKKPDKPFSASSAPVRAQQSAAAPSANAAPPSQAPKPVARAQSPQQSKQAKHDDPPRPPQSASKQKSNEEKKGKD